MTSEEKKAVREALEGIGGLLQAVKLSNTAEFMMLIPNAIKDADKALSILDKSEGVEAGLEHDGCNYYAFKIEQAYFCNKCGFHRRVEALAKEAGNE